LKLLVRAFDAAWINIAKNAAATLAEDRRTRLALIIFALASSGKRDEGEIKEMVVEYMNTMEMPPAHATQH
jgi:hypothetical protein